MKIATTCCLGLLMIIGSVARAQQVVPSSNPPCGGVSATAFVNWARFHFDPCNTGFNPYEFVLSPATVGHLVLDWQYQTGAEGPSSPAVDNGVLYVGSTRTAA